MFFGWSQHERATQLFMQKSDVSIVVHGVIALPGTTPLYPICLKRE